MWVATTTGRVFISHNADAAAGSVTYTRLDTLPSATTDPGRFVSGIYVDPANSNHAWISYSGYNFNTPLQQGHVFSVAYDGSGDATWTDVSYDFPDFPATGIAADSNGDLYVSNDFGVMRLANGATSWASCRYRPSHGGGCWPHDCAECTEALRCNTRPQRMATDIAIKLG